MGRSFPNVPFVATPQIVKVILLLLPVDNTIGKLVNYNLQQIKPLLVEHFRC